MSTFTSNIPMIINNTSTMKDVSAQNIELSGNIIVDGSGTFGTLSVTGNSTVTGLATFSGGISAENFSVADTTGNTTITGNVGIGGSSSTEQLKVTGTTNITSNTVVGGTLGVTGNVGIGGSSSTEQLKVHGDVKITGNIDVDGSFNFNDIIHNISTVNNTVVFSKQLDISNEGTGPALKVSQLGSGDGQDVALFNAGSEGDALKIDSSGKSYFYKDVDISGTITGFGTIPINGIIMWNGSTIPTGWAICDGTNGTPNLSGKFIIGVDPTQTIFNTVQKNGGSLKISVNNLPAHSHTGTLTSQANHVHGLTLGYLNNGGNGNRLVMTASPADGNTLNNVQMAGAGGHTHSFTGGNTGLGTDYVQPYYVLAYIMRII